MPGPDPHRPHPGSTVAPSTEHDLRQRRLVRLMALAVATAVTTITLKAVAWLLTGSVGLLSDALESIVNLAGAAFGLVAVVWAARPPDEEHAYGHEKANYLAAGVEGALILLAASAIVWSAVDRLLNPGEIEQIGVGVAVSAVASVLNLVVARVLIRVGRRDRSLILEADGQHLMTDVWTSVGVVAAVALVALTGAEVLDPIIALLVAVNVLVTGLRLVRRSTSGLMDRALSAEELARVRAVLDRHVASTDRLAFHALRTRRAGPRAFVSVHVLVPGAWSVQQGHDLAEAIEEDLRACVEPATVFTHLEPIEDPASFEDTTLERGGPSDLVREEPA